MTSFGAGVHGRDGVTMADLFFQTRAEAELYAAMMARILHAGPHTVQVFRSEKEPNACVWPRMKEHVEANPQPDDA